LMGVVFAAFDGAPGYTDGTGPLLPASVVSVLGGNFVHLVGTAANAFMFGIVASGFGAALAFTFIFLVGQAPIVALLPRQDEFWVEVARPAPFNVFDHLTNPVIYDAARLAEMNRSREGIERLLSGFEANA